MFHRLNRRQFVAAVVVAVAALMLCGSSALSPTPHPSVPVSTWTAPAYRNGLSTIPDGWDTAAPSSAATTDPTPTESDSSSAENPTQSATTAAAPATTVPTSAAAPTKAVSPSTTTTKPAQQQQQQQQQQQAAPAPAAAVVTITVNQASGNLNTAQHLIDTCTGPVLLYGFAIQEHNYCGGTQFYQLHVGDYVQLNGSAVRPGRYHVYAYRTTPDGTGGYPMPSAYLLGTCVDSRYTVGLWYLEAA